MGMGLGLSIAYNMIMTMNGDVSVVSEEGKGTTYKVHLEFEEYNEGSTIVTSSTESELHKSYDLNGCNILIAEDNSLNRRILGALVANEGMTFVEAADGEEVVNKYLDAPDFTFDCILMDMRMPKLDGIKATQKIRDSGRPDAKTIPIVGVSANGFVEDIKQARRAGIDEYTTKPIERDNLLAVMKKLIRH